MANEQKAPSLASKLAAVMAEVEAVPKRGHNDHFNYDFATEADIASAIRKGLAARHVVMLPSVVSYADQTIVTKGDRGEKSKTITTIKMTFTFLDGDSGEFQTCEWAGRGEDSSDKGLYKAMTGAVKFFLMKAFLIPTGDDPEMDKPDKGARKSDVRSKTQAQARPTVPTGVNPKTGEDESVRVVKVYPPRDANKPGFVEFSDGRKASTFSESVLSLAQRLASSAQLCLATTEQAKKAGGETLTTKDGKPLLNLLELAPISSDAPAIDAPSVNHDTIPF